MRLPQEFTGKMKNLLGETEFDEFLESYKEPRYYGLRVNTLKIPLQRFLEISPFRLEPIPWTQDGFYYREGDNPGKHPYYHAGLYYIQEPSAMLPAAILGAQPGERVLDLCAAPGGKTVQIAASMKGEGLIVANDINSDRVKALVKNIELCGVRNAIVTNDGPEKLSNNFKEYFDRILVDAPCSGEGMFRKDEDAVKSWENYKCDKCASMQKDILQYADKMLKPGGYLVYSTCTFSPEEDEQMIIDFISKTNAYQFVDIPKNYGIEPGRPDWADGCEELKKTARLWPHKLKGEGHFVAMLKKNNNSAADTYPVSCRNESKNIKAPEEFLQFAGENLRTEFNGYYNIKGNNLYHLPVCYPDLSGIKVAKFGWYLGEMIKNRFEPSHSLALSLLKEEMRNVVDFSSISREINSYLKGETIMLEGEKGYTGILVDGFTVGWAKQTGDMLKNLYPKGWRKMH